MLVPQNIYQKFQCHLEIMPWGYILNVKPVFGEMSLQPVSSFAAQLANSMNV